MPGKKKAVQRKKHLTHKGTASASQSALTLAEKKCILLDSLKTVYKKQYDALQPIPYIKDRLYCVDKVFVEGGIEHVLESQSENSQKERLSSYKDIFTDSSSRLYNRRIVKGEAGYGKSTLTLQLAYDWCNGVHDSPVSAADVLILLKLRQLGNVRSIYKAIKVILLPSEFRLNSKDIKDILQRCTTVKIILDGFDEYPNRDKSNRSDIWRIIKSKLFETFDVTLTTRFIPIDFKRSSPKRLELIGFDEKARDQYIRKAITGESNENAVDNIKRGLRENPILDDICQVPLFFVTFAHMTHERDDFRKFKSVTDFFVYMLKCFHSHTRNKASDHNVVSYSVEYENNHFELDKVAFEGLNKENQQITWNKKQLCKRLGKQFYDMYLRVGILVEEEILEDSKRETSSGDIKTNTEVRFYHKIFCEWFASFRLAIVTANANNAFELEQIIGNMDPFDLQYVFRFACGLSRKAARNIIEYLKKQKDCDKFAILCILEQNGDIEEIRKTVTELCSKEVIINRDDSNLLQRSTVQLLQIASSHDIPISDLRLEWSFSKVDNNTIILRSGIALPSLSSLEELCVNAGTDKPELTEEDIVGLLNYALPSEKFRKLR
ncbi:NLR family CARD domain-containing protein 4-like [Apostichopus japonicus]|uniref:NLR family CARD domain-containing protein 4-like n=1 Tax=Stichopus japonicus TaxID=307972 RepID=UPI003AB205B2